MRTSRAVSTLLAGLALPVLAASAAVAAPAVAAGTGSPDAAAASVPRPAAGWQCRSGSAPVTPHLDSTGQVCGRLDGSTWRGRATVTLTARGAAVTGNLFFGPEHLPESPDFGTNADFTVPDGRTVTLTLDYATPVLDSDTGVTWTASPSVSPAPGSGIQWTAKFSSPVITRTPRVQQGVDGGPTTAWTCHTGHVTGTAQTLAATLCVRRDGGYAESKGTLTWTGASGPDVQTGVAVDGRSAVEVTPVLAASPGTPGTVTLPVTRTRLLDRDDTAEAFLRAWPSPDQAETRLSSGLIAIG